MRSARPLAFALAGALAIGTYATALADGPARSTVGPADPYAYTPAPQQLFYNWSGVYIGGNLNIATVTSEGVLNTGVTERTSANATNTLGGVHGGYQHQFRELVLGAEFSYAWGGGDMTTGSVGAPGLSITTNMKDLMMVSGRVGYAYMNLLAYLKGGYASANVDYSESGIATGTASGRANGWVAGVGVNYAVTPNIIIGAEYDYIRLNGEVTTLAPAAATLSGIGLDAQSVMLRLDFKFGG